MTYLRGSYVKLGSSYNLRNVYVSNEIINIDNGGVNPYCLKQVWP